MSKSRRGRGSSEMAVALQYGAGSSAPVVVASGMGYMAEKIVETAADAGVPVYEDNSLATALAQLNLGQEIPEELYQAIVEIYVYFLRFDPTQREQKINSAPQGSVRAEPQSAAAEPIKAVEEPV
ncbi:MAG: EscU/YscU/HrcU family type III secretion system export apparatus switch protein [Oscillospiraceae bacterium]|nr:EscU/YscU/HrcU family type III secretion system export apparatus switch protein [Oscillospiraceae bacterium]